MTNSIVKPLAEMTTEELREEINLLREKRLIARQQSIEENKPKPHKSSKSIKTTKPKGEEVDSEIGNLMDMLMGGSAQVSDEALDIMMKNLESL